MRPALAVVRAARAGSPLNGHCMQRLTGPDSTRLDITHTVPHPSLDVFLHAAPTQCARAHHTGCEQALNEFVIPFAQAIHWMNLGFAVTFTAEIACQALARCFILGPVAYLKSGWHWCVG